jgi:hypothetical protein
MKKLFLILIPLLVLFSACSSKDYYIVPEYEGTNISDGVLLIPTLQEFKIRHTENIFTEDELTLINKKFVTILSENLKSRLKEGTTFQKIDFADFGSRLIKENQTVPFNNGEVLHLNLPAKKIPLDGKERTFILLLENMSLAIFKKEVDTSDPAKFYSASPSAPSDVRLSPLKFFNQMFLCEFNYTIYDNNNSKPVSYGLITIQNKMEENSDLDKLLTRIVEKIAKAVIKDTPFER